MHQWGKVQDLAPGFQGAAPMGAPGSAPSFPCRVAIPLYDADTGLLVLAGKVRSHGWGCSGVQAGTGGCRGVQRDAGQCSGVQHGVLGCSRAQWDAEGCRGVQ